MLNPNLSGDVERLKGPQHVEKGVVSRSHICEKLPQANHVTVTNKRVSEVHTPRQVCDYKPECSLYFSNSRAVSKVIGCGSLQLVGQRVLPKTLNVLISWNSRLPKATNGNGNGGPVVARGFSSMSKGGQLKSSARSSIDQSGTSKNQADIKPNLLEIGLCAGQYKSFFEHNLYVLAYDNLKSKSQSSFALPSVLNNWIELTIKKMKDRSFQFRPAFVYQSKKLSIPTAKDKIVQEVYRMILEPLFEAKFSDHSHGFRPNRSPHTALKQIKQWSGVTWFIEGHFENYFEQINPHLLEKLLSNEVIDKNLLSFFWKFVKAGYLSESHMEAHSLVGVLQGGVLTPFLSNIYLHELDLYIEKLIQEYTTEGKVSKENPNYTKILNQIKKKKKELKTNPKVWRELRKLELQKSNTPSCVRTGSRLYYVRFADKWLIGITGDKALALKIKDLVKIFLLDKLKIAMCEKNTKLVHATSERVFFLGTEVLRRNRKYTESLLKWEGTRLRRATHTRIVLFAPIQKLVAKLVNQKYAHSNGKPKAVTKWIYLHAREIISRFNAVLRGIFNYYSFVENRNLIQRLVWILRFSACFTLARKWNLSPAQIFKKLGRKLSIKDENNQIVAELDLPHTLARTPMHFSLVGPFSKVFDPFKVKFFAVRSHFVFNSSCLICHATENIEMHHVHHLRKKPKKGFLKIKSQLHRKQIPVCLSCHNKIHSGNYNGDSLHKS